MSNMNNTVLLEYTDADGDDLRVDLRLVVLLPFFVSMSAYRWLQRLVWRRPSRPLFVPCNECQSAAFCALLGSDMPCDGTRYGVQS